MQLPEQVLVEHTEWVRRLALRLVGDPHLADDLAQETFTAAWRARGGAAIREPRRWLGAILRNLIREDRRSGGRRDRRERDAARGEATPSTLELVERLAIQRRVAEMVAELDEPYRTTILLRFLEDLPVREIAHRLGVSPSAVSMRVGRGLEKLRARLDDEPGGRRAWTHALLGPLALPALPGTPLVTPSAASAAATASGALIVKAKIAAFAAVLTGLVVTWVVVPGDPPASPAPERGPSAADARDVRADSREPSGVERRVVDGRSTAAHSIADPVTTPTDVFVGRVLDTRSAPVPDVGIVMTIAGSRRLDPGDVRSDVDGRFSMPLPEGAGAIEASSARWSTVLGAAVGPDLTEESVEPVVIVAPRLRLAGSVIDERGTPLSRATVQVVLPGDLRSRFGMVLDRSVQARRVTVTGDDGSFVLDDTGAVAGAVVRASLDGYVPAEVDVPLGVPIAEVSIQLTRPRAVDGALLGVVFDHDGRPAAGAHVALGRAATSTDENGRFALMLDAAGRARTLRAMRRGSRPAERNLEEGEVTGEGPTPFVTLQLGPPPLSISGRLVNADGRAVAGAKVWAVEASTFGQLAGGTASVEGYLGGGLTMQDLQDRFVVDGQPVRPIREILEAHPTATWGWVRTDEGGAFRLEGLLDREYHVAVMMPGSLARVDLGPLAAGSRDVVLRVPAFSVHEVVAGQVVSRRGTPIAGVRIHAQCDPMSLPLEDGGRNTMHEAGVATTTDADGRFRLEGVAAERAYLRLESDRMLPLEYGRGVDGGITGVDGLPADALRIEVSLRMHVRVVLVDASEADALATLDADGQPLPINVFTGHGRRTTDEVPFDSGRSPTLAVMEDVTTIRLLKDGDPVRDVPVTLVEGDVQELRL